jgi:hypothetical protein
MSVFRRLALVFPVSFSTNLGHFGRPPDQPLTGGVAFSCTARRVPPRAPATRPPQLGCDRRHLSTCGERLSEEPRRIAHARGPGAGGSSRPAAPPWSARPARLPHPRVLRPAHIERPHRALGRVEHTRPAPRQPGNWEPVEWDELLDGRLGPWSIAVERELAVSICHTPGPVTARGAECGVWTLPAFRARSCRGNHGGVGRAHAADRTPRVLRHRRGQPFVTAVGRRLNLRPLGWLWQLHAPRASGGPAFHPRSALLVSVRGTQSHGSRDLVNKWLSGENGFQICSHARPRTRRDITEI